MPGTIAKPLRGLGLLSLCLFVVPQSAHAADAIDSGDTAWMLVSCALVMLMTPGLALFYAGMVRSKNVVSTMMYSFIALGVMSVQWSVIGYSLAFGGSVGGVIGGLEHAFLSGVGLEANGSIPAILFMLFQGMFAIITPALISGALVERTKFIGYVVFIVLWGTIVYDPLCHWIWGGGWLAGLGVLDFAGGLVVHLSSGVSALVVVFYLGKRLGWPEQALLPHNLSLTALGAGLLWFGWFGFNAGSALASGAQATVAITATHMAGAGGAFSWCLVEYIEHRKISMVGIASGLVAGLACVTPAAGFIAPMSGLIIGLAISPICYFAISLKNRFRYDDSLDVFGIHGVSGIVGSLAVGVFASAYWSGNPELSGLLSGSVSQLGSQALGVIVVGGYSAVVTLILLVIVDKLIGLRVNEDIEQKGLDHDDHGESGYDL